MQTWTHSILHLNAIQTDCKVYLLYGVWHVGIYEPEEQVSEGPALSSQNHSTSTPRMSQGQVDGQQLHAQQEKLMVVPEEYTHTERIRHVY